MNTEQKSFPVRYMPILIANDYGVVWDIVDTLDNGNEVASAYTEVVAYAITKALNEAEGYVYEP